MTVKTVIGEITAGERTLNTLCMFVFECAIHQKEQGYKTLASEAQNVADEIHKALSDNGYYKEIESMNQKKRSRK